MEYLQYLDIETESIFEEDRFKKIGFYYDTTDKMSEFSDK